MSFKKEFHLSFLKNMYVIEIKIRREYEQMK